MFSTKFLKFRNYPKEYSIAIEMIIAFFTNYGVNIFFEFANRYKKHLGSDTYCLFGIMDNDYFGNLCRGYSFMLTLYIITSRSTQHFPLPFSWIFDDFQKFIFEPDLVKVFRNYLTVVEPGKVSTLDSIMLAFLDR